MIRHGAFNNSPAAWRLIEPTIRPQSLCMSLRIAVWSHTALWPLSASTVFNITLIAIEIRSRIHRVLAREFTTRNHRAHYATGMLIPLNANSNTALATIELLIVL
jgi:hypothetical protein